MGILRRFLRHRATSRDAGPRPASRAAISGATDPGPRAENQDRWGAGDGWAVVCDGVGGHRGGATAAGLALDAAVAVLTDPRPATAGDPGTPPGFTGRLVQAVEAANDAVLAGRAADTALAEMASTLTAAARDPSGDTPTSERWVVVQLGDSPAWHVGRTSGAATVTWDHSLVAYLVRAGALTPAEARIHPARHVVTRAIGIAPVVQPETFTVDLAAGDLLVLCSDGVSDVAGPEVVPLVRDAPDVAAALVAEALARDTRDNVTVVAIAAPRDLPRAAADGDRRHRAPRPPE